MDSVGDFLFAKRDNARGEDEPCKCAPCGGVAGYKWFV